MPTPRATPPFNLPRWTAEDAREALGALERSGKAVTVFAAEHGLDAQRLYAWRRRLGECAERTPFRELVVRASGVPDEPTRPWFEVVLPSGAVVRVPPSFDTEALGRLLDVLARAVAC